MWHEFAKNVILWAVFYLCLRMIQKLFVKFLCLGIDIMLSYSLQFDDKSYIFLKFSNDLQIHIAVKCAGEDVTSEARCSKFYWTLQISPIVCVNGAQECDRFIFRYRKWSVISFCPICSRSNKKEFVLYLEILREF